MPIRPRSGRPSSSATGSRGRVPPPTGALKRDLAALRVDAGHDVLDGAVFAGRVHRLEDHQQGQRVLGVEPVWCFASCLMPFSRQAKASLLSLIEPVHSGSWSFSEISSPAGRSSRSITLRISSFDSSLLMCYC